MEISSALRGKNYGVKHILAEYEASLAEILNNQLSLAQDRIEELVEMGAVYLNEERFKHTHFKQIPKGSYLRVHQNPRRFPIQNFNLPTSLVFENNDFLVINKISGVPVHPTVDNQLENIIHKSSILLGYPVHVTHRLDVATSGLLVLAKTKEFQKNFNDYLLKSEVKKLYRSLCHGLVNSPRELTHYMEPSPRAPKKLSEYPQPGWAQCRLKILDSTEVVKNNSDLLIELLTGRTHQIRTQLSAIGHPVVGDQMYGSPIKLSSDGELIALQSCFIGFPDEKNSSQFQFRLFEAPWSYPVEPKQYQN